jgi:hypothetical protein
MNAALTSTFKGSRLSISKTVTANYTFDEQIEIVNADATSGPITITLPLISTNNFRSVTVRKIDSSANTVTVAGNGSDLYQGGASFVLSSQWDVKTVNNNGAQWFSTGAGGGGYTPPAAYSGSPFLVTAAGLTIPSNYELVVLKSTIGDVVMTGTPLIQAGTTIGQRLTLLMASDSTGSIDIGTDATFKPTSLYPGTGIVRLIHDENGLGIHQAIQLVWGPGPAWRQTSFQVEATLRQDIDSVSVIAANLNNTGQISLSGPQTFTDPLDSDIFNVQTPIPTSQVDIELTTADLVLTGTPNFTASQYGLFWLKNSSTSSFNLTIQDESILVGSNLKLRSATVTLKPSEAILFRGDTGGVWVEMARAVVRERIQTLDVLTATTLAIGNNVDTMMITLSGGSATPTTPAFSSALTLDDGHEILVMVDPAETNSLTLEDEGTTAGSALRLSATSLVLTPGSSVKLRWNATAAKWFEVAKTILV